MHMLSAGRGGRESRTDWYKSPGEAAANWNRRAWRNKKGEVRMGVKYELTGETAEAGGVVLHRIRALRDICMHEVKGGTGVCSGVSGA